MTNNQAEKRIQILEKKLGTLKKKLSVTLKRTADIVNNQKHYLRHRKKKVDARQAALLSAASRYAKRMKDIPKIKVALTKMSKSGKNRIILMVTNNQARKLRALAEMDLRPILNSRGNSDPKTRARLSEPGTKSYKNT